MSQCSLALDAPGYEAAQIAAEAGFCGPIYALSADSQVVGLNSPSLRHGAALEKLFHTVTTPYLILFFSSAALKLHPQGLPKLVSALVKSGAALVYGDHMCVSPSGQESRQELIEYQSGSVRDDFDFGPLVLLQVQRARKILSKHCYRIPPGVAGFYGLRLCLSMDKLPQRIAEVTYSVCINDSANTEARHFRYVSPDNVSEQREMEESFIQYARHAGFFLRERTQRVDLNSMAFDTQASVIIPVRNRAGTIAQAVASALSQQASFTYNVIVVDNYSDDGTEEQLSKLAAKDSRLIVIRPARQGHGIGGCWNEAIRHASCGRICVQLDSDDLYDGPQVLQRIFDVFHREQVAAVVGSYKLVDFDLNEIPPGVIAHREWTDENGHNNALRINGFGAPRAFYTPVVRDIGFLDVSYGEDYAMLLSITRRFRIARILEPLYLCRRWPGNSDSNPSSERLNAFNTFKDQVRSREIEERLRLALLENSNG